MKLKSNLFIGKRPLEIIPDLATYVPGHVDIPRMREGRLGGAFFTVWAPCPELVDMDVGKDFLGMTDVCDFFPLEKNICIFIHTKTNMYHILEFSRLHRSIGSHKEHDCSASRRMTSLCDPINFYRRKRLTQSPY